MLQSQIRFCQFNFMTALDIDQLVDNKLKVGQRSKKIKG